MSKETYIQRNEYHSTINFTSASDVVSHPTVSYDIQTLGLTTDVVATLFQNFNLYLLLTMQAPKYKNYSGTIDFGNGEVIDYSFNDNTVTRMSKDLIEIDPSYQWNNFRLWASTRYFRKGYESERSSGTDLYTGDKARIWDVQFYKEDIFDYLQ